MNTSATRRTASKAREGRLTIWQKYLFLLLVLPLWLPAADLEASKITLAPKDLSVNVAPGEVVMVPVTATLSETSVPNSFALFSFTQAGGDIDPSWINSRVYVSLGAWGMSRQAILQVRPPADARGGVYTGTLRTVLIDSNETVDAVDFVINVKVNALVSCNQAPLFSDITSTEDIIDARNNKPVTIDLAGSVTETEGCEIGKAWYQLTDEYGELDQTEAVTINADGSFAVSVPLIASRKGNDKDGRLYTVKFMAENEAGFGESSETSIVVAHDNRKK